MREFQLKKAMTQVGVNWGALPCDRLACATSSDCVTKEPHLSPQHYELNAIEHVLRACAGLDKSIA